MLFRFSLYGFLKNQRYFEPFILLAFMQKGLSFAMIGLLIGFREICINIMEIPSGAVADVAGRRKSMILSFVSYSISYAIFGLSSSIWALFVAMFFFSVGEAFRTGTHKAIIFNWLATQDRQDEKTAVYGFTRSWSKMGSAVSVVIAGIMVFIARDYSIIFLFCIIPSVINIINFLTYPKYLDGSRSTNTGISSVTKTLMSSLIKSIKSKQLRRVLFESMGYEGLYKASKDYLQPVLQTAALALPLFLFFDGQQRTAILVGAIYFLLHTLSSIASRNAGKFVSRFGGEIKASRYLWIFYLFAFILLGFGILGRYIPVVILAFILLAILQNFWRPILIGRCATLSDESQTATILSIESQTKSLFVAVIAPFIGWAIDTVAAVKADWQFLPIAVLGFVISAFVVVFGRDRN
jgi:MFS family permease